MKLGFVASAYPPPEGMFPRPAGAPRGPFFSIDATKWHMDKTQELGGGVIQVFLPPDVDQAQLEELKAHAAKTNMEFELNANVIGLANADTKAETLERLNNTIKNAKFLGANILRGAYGRLVIEYSRFNKEWPLKDHMQYLIDNLKEAAKVMESEGMYFALENHCDFTGKEFAEIYTAVNSKHIGCTLDTANGFTVFCDPNEDIEYLAEFTIATHLKDMLVQQFRSEHGLPMFQARGCALGDGHVNIPRALELLNEKSPMRDGLHLVIEHGWMNMDGVEDRAEYNRQCLEKGLAYLKKCVGRA
jgi:sugar phosphate isomerase/epimerase